MGGPPGQGSVVRRKGRLKDGRPAFNDHAMDKPNMEGLLGEVGELGLTLGGFSGHGWEFRAS